MSAATAKSEMVRFRGQIMKTLIIFAFLFDKSKTYRLQVASMIRSSRLQARHISSTDSADASAQIKYNNLPLLWRFESFHKGYYLGQGFWHQNSHFTRIQIPLALSTSTDSIIANFLPNRVSICANSVYNISEDTYDVIIPGGSSWTFEYGRAGERWLQIELEKRFVSLNWESVHASSQTLD